MSKFINTQHKVTIDSLVEGFLDNYKNPYYLYNDKHPTLVTYYNLDLGKSTLDEGLKIEYSALGKDSPFKFNKINNFYLYGIERIITNWDSGDWGLESDSIEGEAIVLPNTIEPIANDFFTINHLNKTLLFKVTHVTIDTIENGANFYKIQYKLDQLENSKIEAQVDEEFELIVNNVGTQFKSVIRSNDYNYIDEVEDVLDRLKEYYFDLFYSQRVQTFRYNHNGFLMYDPYMIEFLKRNEILKDNDNYVYINHQTTLQATFAIDYDKTFFRFIEMPDIERHKRYKIYAQARTIDEYLSILSFREEDYCKVEYIDDDSLVDKTLYVFNPFDAQLMDNIFTNTKFADNDYRNIIIKYFNKEDIIADDIYKLNNIEFSENIELFYNIPIIIYIINNTIKKLLRTNK